MPTPTLAPTPTHAHARNPTIQPTDPERKTQPHHHGIHPIPSRPVSQPYVHEQTPRSAHMQSPPTANAENAIVNAARKKTEESWW